MNEVLTHRGTGHAGVTVLNESGRPTPVAPTSMWAPLASWDRQALTFEKDSKSDRRAHYGLSQLS
ncbi:hypothetical protein [Schaalia turicensis]|uniref:hypothetical protein n=1 Tax=Schaalia turicensis TaxID=131111 RepID=UPI00311C8FC3